MTLDGNGNSHEQRTGVKVITVYNFILTTSLEERRKTERNNDFYCSTYFCIHSLLILVCALTRDLNRNFGVSG